MRSDRCSCTDHGPPSNPSDTPCKNTPRYVLQDEDGRAYLCNRHARAVRNMYEPGQIRKLRAVPPSSTDTKGKDQ